MNKQIRLLVETFFDDEIFNVDNDIKSNIEDLGRYYDYKVGDIYYLNDKPYAICCGESKQFNNNTPRFCLLDNTVKGVKWSTSYKEIKELNINNISGFCLNSFKDFQHIDEDGYENTQIIKNNYNIHKFPAFEYCINLADNIYLPAIDELSILFLNKNKIKDTLLCRDTLYWSSTQYNKGAAYILNAYMKLVFFISKQYTNNYIFPFLKIN